MISKRFYTEKHAHVVLCVQINMGMFFIIFFLPNEKPSLTYIKEGFKFVGTQLFDATNIK